MHNNTLPDPDGRVEIEFMDGTSRIFEFNDFETHAQGSAGITIYYKHKQVLIPWNNVRESAVWYNSEDYQMQVELIRRECPHDIWIELARTPHPLFPDHSVVMSQCDNCGAQKEEHLHEHPVEE